MDDSGSDRRPFHRSAEPFRQRDPSCIRHLLEEQAGDRIESGRDPMKRVHAIPTKNVSPAPADRG